MTKYFDRHLIIKLGILVAGVFLSYRSAVYFKSLFWINEIDLNLRNTFLIYYLIYVCVMLLGFLISLSGVAKLKRWGVRVLQIVCFIVHVDLVRGVAVMSYHSLPGVLAILGSILSYSLMHICATRKIRSEFQFQPGLLEKSVKWKTFFAIFSGVIGSLIGILLLSYLTHYYYFYPNQKITYEVQNNEALSSYDLLKHSFQSAVDLRVSSILPFFPEPHDFRMTHLTNEDGSLTVGVNLKPGDYIARIFYYRNSYEFNRRLLRMFRFICKAPFLNKEKFKVAEINVGSELEGFLLWSNWESAGELYYFLVYRKDNRNSSGSLGIMFKNQDAANQQIVNQIIGSLKLKETHTKSDIVYFNEAMTFVQNNNLQAAQMLLVNALDQNWKNPEYHYQLALAFMKTGNNDRASFSFQEALKLNPDYKDAKSLLDEVAKQLELESK